MKDGNDPTRNLWFLLSDITRGLRRDFARRSAHLGLTEAQWRALAYLTRAEGLNQTQLAERLDVQPMSLVRVIDGLEASGWVERRPDPKDRRAFKLYLTEAAVPVITEMQRFGVETRMRALSGLSDEARERLYAELEVLKANLTDENGGE